jgi:mannose-6-phosphate isomerase-like protein (cupin superfamily)
MQVNNPSYSVFEAGAMSDWKEFAFPRPDGKGPTPKQFLKQPLGLTSMELSLNGYGAKAAMPFRHHHKENEELYVFLSGEGEFEADGKMIPIKPGTCIRCAPGTARAWRNTGKGDFHFICIQAKEGSYGPQHTTQDGQLSEGNPPWVK